MKQGKKQKYDKKQISIEKPIIYSRAEIMLDIMRSEYEAENDRKKILDSKATTFITMNIALLTIFIPLIPFAEVTNFWSKACECMKWILLVCFIGLGISIILLVWAFIILVIAAGIAGYSRVRVSDILSEASRTDEIDISSVELGLISHYYIILNGDEDSIGNCNLNTNRANKVQRGIVITVVGYVLLFVNTVLLRIVIGG